MKHSPLARGVAAAAVADAVAAAPPAVAIALLTLVLAATPACLAGPDEPALGFDPTQLDNKALYLISTDFGPHPIAACNSAACFSLVLTEDADIAQMYCDTAAGAIPGAVGYAPEGCVRWWEDQGDFDCGVCGAGVHADEWVRGHEHGQDDVQKPAYVAECLNGQPCGRIPSVAEMGPNATQIACWERQFDDTLRVSGDFSILFLMAPRDQPADWWYFGASNNGLHHRASDDALFFRTSATPEVQITVPGAVNVAGGVWQLIEVYRNGAGQYQVFVNGADVTAPGPPTNTADYGHRYLGARNCNGTTEGMLGDVAAFFLFSDLLTPGEREQVRQYLDDVYDYHQVFADGFESGTLVAWSSAVGN